MVNLVVILINNFNFFDYYLLNISHYLSRFETFVEYAIEFSSEMGFEC